jgi:CubicO group peptidase (beta-lactamase class C family)
MKKYTSLNMKKATLLIAIISLSIFKCIANPPNLYTYQIPEKIIDGLDVGSLEEVNIDSALIVDAVDNILAGRFKEIHSMLIFKNDKLIFEEYFPGHKYKWDAPNHHGELVSWEKNMLHDIKSDTKSITSTCIGIAIDQGFIKNVQQSIFVYLPEHQHLKTDGKGDITIEHLVTMTSGLKWNEWGAPLSSPDNDIVGLWFNYEDPITGVLDQPLKHKPGSKFTYSGGGMILLGEILKNATKMTIDKFSEKYLFELLGIDSSNWALQFENGVFEAAGGLEITPRAMVKIGVTFLNNGVWDGKRIISEKWIQKSANSFSNNKNIKIPGTDSGRNDYGYSWWIKSFSHSDKKINLFYAGGWGGQYIMVIPELNTVVVFTGGNYLSKVQNFKILNKYILPAIG